MATVTFILGYCGSGKTPLADEMEKMQGVKKFDESFAGDRARHRELIADLRKGVDCVVTEIQYCLEAPRQRFVEELQREIPGVTIKYEAFEADLVMANENCRRRTKGDAAGHIWINTMRIGSRYIIPPGVTPRPITPLSDAGK